MQFVRLFSAFCVLAVLQQPAAAQQSSHARVEPPRALEVEMPAGRFVGLPVHWSPHDAVIMEHSGRFHVLDPSQMLAHRILREIYEPQSLPQARSQLAAELGHDFETVISGPYVIAAPKGQAERWQQRFRTLLAGYQRYFELRDCPLRRPDFPLCVIIMPDRNAFLRYARQESDVLPNQAVGCYFPKSNRCVLYQLPGAGGTNWSQTEFTIVHEAVHQLAYNTGIHERLFENSLWFVEGLATMFETPAVYDAGVSRSSIADRMHPEMLARLKPILARRGEFELRVQELIGSDELFKTAGLDAYAISWAMSFYLAERMPREYGFYMQLQSRRGFGSYSTAERHADFRAAFETSPESLAHQIRRLLDN
jgi:hypothetical protein